MWIEEKLKAIVQEAALDFDKTIAQDRKINSDEDGTARGNHLDQILFDQKIEREQLWAKLHELEDAEAVKGLNILYQSHEDPCEIKYLDTLKNEEQGLRRQLDQQLIIMNGIERPSNETVVELQFKERLGRTAQQLHTALKSIDVELTEAEDAKERELHVLRDCEEITRILERRLEEAQQPESRERVIVERREKLNILRDKHKIVMDELVAFLTRYYPPHQVDGGGKWDSENDEPEMCDLSFILEDLMNLLVLKPHDPYLPLQKGLYWSPYIETLIKAGVAERHPEDVDKIRLVDFRL